MSSPAPTLGYWDIRALAQPIRDMLKYAGVQFKDVRYSRGDVDFKETSWFKEKEKFASLLDFPNIPYYIDNDVKLTQSIAIMRFLGRRHGLFAQDAKSQLRQDLAEQQLQDFRWTNFIMFLWSYKDGRPGFEEAKKEYVAKLPDQLGPVSKFLGNNTWFAGDQLTYVDFMAYELFDWIRLFSPGSVEKYDNLVKFMARFEQLPAIVAYKKSSEFQEYPIFPEFMPFGFKKEN